MIRAADTTPAALRAAASAFGTVVAVHDRDVAFDYTELLSRVRRAAANLVHLGVEPGDRVAVWAPNTWHWVVAALATHYAGATLIPLNTRYTATEATDLIVRSRARVLVIAGRFLGTERLDGLDPAAVTGLRAVVRIPVDDNSTAPPFGTVPVYDWDDFVALAGDPVAADARADAVRPGDVSDILFTSGTTGRSKGALCAHGQSLASSLAWARCGEITSADRYLVINPFFHSFGYKAGILACLQTGATLVPQLTFDPGVVMHTIAEQRITVLPGPPTIYQTLLDHPGRPEYDLTSLRFAVTGAAVVPVALIERMQTELDFDLVLTAYGLSESGGFGTMCRSDDDAVTVATTCGRAIADYELRIAESGELLMRGPNVMLGYLDDPDATAETVDSDGWLHTGDIGTLDDRGYLTITDRLKDMYISGGFNVYPAEVEQVIARIPGVAESAVIGVPDDRLGEVGRAVVVRTAESTITEKDVVDHCRTHLANFKVPRSVRFDTELPRNAGGKVLKRLLREEKS